MWPALTTGVVFIETPIYYRYISQIPCTFLLPFYLSTHCWKISLIWNFFPWFWLKTSVFSLISPTGKSFQNFPWSVGTLSTLKSHLLEKPFGHVLPKVSKTLLPPPLKHLVLFLTCTPTVFTGRRVGVNWSSTVIADSSSCSFSDVPDFTLFSIEWGCNRKKTRSTYRAIQKATGLTVNGIYMIWLVLFHHSTIPSLKPPVAKEPAVLWIALLGMVHCERG